MTWTRQKWLSNLNWMELKVSSFFSLNLSYIDWISVFLLFYTIRFPSAILCRQMMKAQNVSCFGDCSNTLIRISLFHWSNPKRYHRFSVIISHDVHQFESESLEKCPIEALFYFEQILGEIRRNFQSTLLSLIFIRFGVSVKFLLASFEFEIDCRWRETLCLHSLHFILLSFDNVSLTSCNVHAKLNNLMTKQWGL